MATNNLSLAVANTQLETIQLLTGSTSGANATGSTTDASGSSFMDILDAVGGAGSGSSSSGIESLLQAMQSSDGSSTAATTGTPDLYAMLSSMMSVGAFGNTSTTGSDASSALAALQGTGTSSSLNQVLGDGSNLLLTAFNSKQSSYSTELSRLELMQSDVANLSTTATSLQSLTTDTSNDDIKAALQNFVQQYNAWDSEFDADVAKGGDLQDSQPANAARFSMLRDVNDIFNGHGNGGLGNGMSDLGIQVGSDGQIQFDTALFDKAIASDKTVAVKTITNMGQEMSRDADSLDSSGKPLANRITRLEDALNFIAQNKPWIEAQAETQQVAALSMYQSMTNL
jgi:hypothetical protein